MRNNDFDRLRIKNMLYNIFLNDCIQMKYHKIKMARYEEHLLQDLNVLRCYNI